MQTAVANGAVVVAGLVLGLALVGRIDLLARVVTLLFLLATVLNLALWTLYREAPQLFAAPGGAGAIRAVALLMQVALLVWLLRAPGRQWLPAGLVMAVVFVAAKDVAQRLPRRPRACPRFWP
ncbi:MAG: hypothetical protein ACK4IU_09690 [Tabrizicola flagellatus]|uniref:hypothetical protein n=1 Tax=Tabrizicola flagellatus TaxID=2593021 RepID=UPI003919CC44